MVLRLPVLRAAEEQQAVVTLGEVVVQEGRVASSVHRRGGVASSVHSSQCSGIQPST